MAAIDWSKISSDLRAAFANRLPSGTPIENVRECPARVARFEVPDEKVLTAFEQAGGPKMITNGKPTIMRVVAWLGHEGINKNRLAFERVDLEQAAAKIRQPDFLPMDFNHSAVDSWGFGQKAIGVWYHAEMAQDPEAGGAWGVLAYGMMWSWLNPDLADRLLAEQSRNGRIDFSMACIAGRITEARDDDGPYEIAGDTTFFTLSALDVPPADPHATGVGIEGSEDPNLEQELRQKLTAGAVAAAKLSMLRVARIPEAKMEELLAQLKELSAHAAKLADANLKETVVAAIEAKLDEIKGDAAKAAALESQVADLTTKLEAAEAALTTSGAIAEARVAELEAKVGELEAAKTELEAKVASMADKDVALEAAKAELGKANAEVERLAKEIETAKVELAKYQQAELDKASADKAAARYAELPAAYRDAFEKKDADEQAKAKARWAELSDEGWKAFVADLGVIPVAKSYLTRSKEEQIMPATAPASGNVKTRLSQFK